MHTCTHMHTHTMHTCTCTHIMHTHNAYMHTQGERRLIGLQDCWGRGRGASYLAKTKAGGGTSQSGIKQGGLTSPPGYRPAYTHTYTHMHIHTYTRIHTHNAHINRHAHVCMCIASSCVYMCAYTYTHTQKYCWTANTL